MGKERELLEREGPKTTPHADAGRFIELYTSHEARLRGYVLSLVPRWSDAEDIVQRCSVILWKKFDQYEAGTNFFAWACQVVRFEVKAFSRKVARERLVFSDAFVEAVAQQTVDHQAELERRLDALQKCVAKLPAEHRELLRLRYDERRSVESVAKVVHRSMEGIYKSLSRIRQTLHTCIRRRLAAGEV